MSEFIDDLSSVIQAAAPIVTGTLSFLENRDKREDSRRKSQTAITQPITPQPGSSRDPRFAGLPPMNLGVGTQLTPILLIGGIGIAAVIILTR